MRLSNVENGHTPERKRFLEMMGQMRGGDAPSVIKTLMYRPEFFGEQFSALTNEALRGTSEWTRGERELFAGYVSRVNECEF